MVRVYFTHKRLVLFAGTVGRALAEIVGLTPARVDLLFRLVDGPILQRDLVLEMGVVPAVVSRMLTALEALGLVERSVAPRDRRFRVVTLLDEGKARLETLYDGFLPDSGLGTIQTSAEDYIASEWWKALADEGVRADAPAHEDKRSLLRRMTIGVWKMDYLDEWGLRPPPALATGWY